MRVIHFADYGGPYSGSFIPMLKAALLACRSRGWQVEAVFSQDAIKRDWLHELEDENIPVRFAPTNSRLKLHRWLIELLGESDDATILHTHFTAFDIAAAVAASRHSNTKVFWHVHSFLHPELLARIRNTLKFAIAGRLVNGIICVTDEIAVAVRNRLGPSGRVRTLKNAIDTDRFPILDSQQRESARAELELPLESRVLIHFGWYWQAKGGDLFLKTVKLLLERGEEDIVAVSVGGGEQARNTGRAIGLGNSLRVLEPSQQVQKLYAAADLFVSTSQSEGMPFSVIEALSMGLPVVATDIPGHAQIGQQLKACRLTPPDPHEIADSATAVLNRDTESAKAAASSAHDWIEDHFGLAAWTERLLDLYDSAVGHSGGQ